MAQIQPLAEKGKSARAARWASRKQTWPPRKSQAPRKTRPRAAACHSRRSKPSAGRKVKSVKMAAVAPIMLGASGSSRATISREKKGAGKPTEAAFQLPAFRAREAGGGKGCAKQREGKQGKPHPEAPDPPFERIRQLQAKSSGTRSKEARPIVCKRKSAAIAPAGPSQLAMGPSPALFSDGSAAA